jgi:hypothetical protein
MPQGSLTVKKKPLGPRVQIKAEVQPESSQVIELAPAIYQLRGEKPGSHVYLIKGIPRMFLLIPGLPANSPS